jgi:hypothetical protein
MRFGGDFTRVYAITVIVLLVIGIVVGLLLYRPFGD